MKLPVPVRIRKLRDRFGQYVLTLRCQCGHARQADPRTLAAIDGWDASLADVVRRLRCARCGSGLAAGDIRTDATHFAYRHPARELRARDRLTAPRTVPQSRFDQ